MTYTVDNAHQLMVELHENYPMDQLGKRAGFILLRENGTMDVMWRQICFGNLGVTNTGVDQSLPLRAKEIKGAYLTSENYWSRVGTNELYDAELTNAYNPHGFRKCGNSRGVSVLVNSLRTCFFHGREVGGERERMSREVVEFFRPFYCDSYEGWDSLAGVPVDLNKVNRVGLGQILVITRNCLEFNLAPAYFTFRGMGLTIPQSLTLSKFLRISSDNSGFNVWHGMGHTELDYLASRFVTDKPLLEQVDKLGMYTEQVLSGECTDGCHWTNGIQDAWGAKQGFPADHELKKSFRSLTWNRTAVAFGAAVPPDLSLSQLKEML